MFLFLSSQSHPHTHNLISVVHVISIFLAVILAVIIAVMVLVFIVLLLLVLFSPSSCPRSLLTLIPSVELVESMSLLELG